LFFNFTDLATRKESIRYHTDVLKLGQVGGYCDYHAERLEKELTQMSALQSWAPELRFFERLYQRPMEEGHCDIIVDKPTFIMKIDSTMNMYHHFCDFFNLYASLHLNLSHPSGFSTDNQIVVWESYDYVSPFAKTFKAFTSNPILDLKAFRGNTVCFKNVVLPLLPRMIFGLFYNTPIVS
jgi:EGF domain-specific O-GlcNAc transferase